MQTELRPMRILKDISKQYPHVWQHVKEFRARKGKDLPNWPDWCYIPIAAGCAIATQGSDSDVMTAIFDKMLSPAVITAAAAWRVTKGICRFDADLYNSLINQPLDGNIPCDALKRLPEWCVYIETMHGLFFLKQPVEGFWAHLEYDSKTGREELRLVLMLKNGFNMPFPIHLGDWTLEEGVNQMMEETENMAKSQEIEYQFPRGIDFVSQIVPCVQLVLYLCAENMDMPVLPKHPATRVRMSGQADVMKEPRIWNVGIRIGAAIRKYNNEQREETKEKTDETGIMRASPRPHVRRAHWHHFWAGPMKGERKLVLRWLPPIPVGYYDESETEQPMVIHRIK